MHGKVFSYPSYEIGKLHDCLYTEKSDHIHLVDSYLDRILESLIDCKNELFDGGHHAEYVAVLGIITGIHYPIQELRIYFEGHFNNRIKVKVARNHFKMIENILDDLNKVVTL